MSQNIPELTTAQKKQIADTLTHWASVHPQPDQGILYVGAETLTPRKMAEAATQPDTEMGQLIHRLFAIGTTEAPLSELLADYNNDANKWAAQKKTNTQPKRGGPTP